MTNKDFKTILQEKVTMLEAESEKLAKIAFDQQEEISTLEAEINKKKDALMKSKCAYSEQHEILHSARKLLKSL